MTNIKDLFQEGYTQHQAGNFVEAVTLYQEILNRHPNNVDALFLLGTLSLQQGNLDVAGMNLRKVIELNPDNVIAYNNLANVLQKQSKLVDAVAIYHRAISIKPDYVDAHYNLGNVLKELNNYDGAIKSYERTIALKPDDAMAHNNLATVLQEQGRFDEAIKSYRQVIALKPDDAMAYNNLATVLQEQERFDEAIKSYRKAITLKPDYADAHYNLGNTLKEQGKFCEAASSYKQAIMINPNYTKAFCNLGNALKEQNKFEDAKTYYRRAIEIEPDCVDAYNNLGITFQEQGKLNEAIASFDRAIAIKPDYADAHMNKSFALFLAGELEEGWPEYEWRLRTKKYGIRSFPQLKWDGAPLNGKPILVHAEQGYGDTIQFIRYLPMVKAQGGHVIFESRQSLVRLLEGCSGFDEIIERTSNDIPSVQFDVHVPLLSLPGIFNTTLETIPSGITYITPDFQLVEQWCGRIGHEDTFKIGITWAGSPTFKNYRERSCSLSDFAPLADIPGITLYSIQKGPASIEISSPPEGMKIVNLEKGLNDFADTAAVMANLDLIISTDTAVVHLAGAIGKPVWTLLHFVPDWRWLMDCNDSPWYPSMRLFRQTRPNDWAGVFEQVKNALITQYSALKV